MKNFFSSVFRVLSIWTQRVPLPISYIGFLEKIMFDLWPGCWSWKWLVVASCCCCCVLPEMWMRRVDSILSSCGRLPVLRGSDSQDIFEMLKSSALSSAGTEESSGLWHRPEKRAPVTEKYSASMLHCSILLFRQSLYVMAAGTEETVAPGWQRHVKQETFILRRHHVYCIQKDDYDVLLLNSPNLHKRRHQYYFTGCSKRAKILHNIVNWFICICSSRLPSF